jgi:hypothetical protein
MNFLVQSVDFHPQEIATRDEAADLATCHDWKMPEAVIAHLM